jgi:hypothetical protein
MNALSGWENFYVIVGSSAGALIGLQFVVITLIADLPVARGQEDAGAAFATPTIVHFGAVLLLSAIVSAPWHGVIAVAVVWGVLGTVGVVYQLFVFRSMRIQKVYSPELEDWLLHVLLPLVAYAGLAASFFVAQANVRGALFCVAGVALALLLIGIHNAWDAVIYHVFVQRRKHQEKSSAGK